MTVPALLSIDVVGRRPLMLIGTIIMMISFYYIGTYQELNKNSIAGQIDIMGYISIFCIYLFMTGNVYCN
jgi:hypothetical protein